MCIRATSGIDQSFDDEILGRQVRGADIQADDIHTLGFQVAKFLSEGSEKIRFEAGNPFSGWKRLSLRHFGRSNPFTRILEF